MSDELPFTREEYDSTLPRRKVRVTRKGNRGYHPYHATASGEVAYGWGDSPEEAVAKLYEVRYDLALERAAYRRKEPMR
jgi:hypothetical protein